jgi:DNA-binding transcriptional ArsR family regulator
LSKLKLAGLVRSRRQGKHQIYLLDDRRVGALLRLARSGHGRGDIVASYRSPARPAVPSGRR